MTGEFLPYGRQQIEEADLSAVAAALADPLITQGPRVRELEDAVRERTGAAHAIAYSSGTSALHGAAFACGLGPGSVGLVPTLTFAASANCLRYVGAEPHFVDVDEATFNVSPAAIERTVAERGPVDAVVAVSFAGLPVGVEALREAAPGVPIIEDGCHALGGHRAGRPVGGPGGADMTAFSFHPVKVITSGEGGMLTTEDDELALRARRFREHGMDRNPAHAEGPWAYDIVQEGYNYRLTDFQSALATSQLNRLDEWVERRNEVAVAYRELLDGDPDVELPPAAPEGSLHAYHLFVVRVPAGSRRRVFEGLRAAGIGVQVHYVPLDRFSLFSECPRHPTPEVDRYYESAISLPMFPSMRREDVERVVSELRRLLSEVPTGAR